VRLLHDFGSLEIWEDVAGRRRWRTWSDPKCLTFRSRLDIPDWVADVERAILLDGSWWSGYKAGYDYRRKQ
jgi:hypothetical protein